MIIFILFTIFVVSAIISQIKFKTGAKGFKGSPVLPFIGNAHELIGSSTDFYQTIYKLWNEHGSRFRMFIGNNLFLCISDAKDVEVVLSSNQLIDKSTEYRFMQPWLGTGLLTSGGEKWRKHRKVITPTFHFKILEPFIQIFDSQSNILIKKLKKHNDEKSFDLFPYITLCALDVISEAAMGVNINAQSNKESEYVKAVQNICRILLSRMKNPFKRLDFLYRFTSDYSEEKKALKILHSFTYKMINERRKLLENKDISSITGKDDSDEILGQKKRLAFLDMLLLSTLDGKPLDDISIREEVDTFLFEGHDTTTSGIVFALYLIANNPEVQEKLYEEQKDIFGDNFNKPTTYSDLQNMKYLDLAIKESLRLYPPVPIIARKVYEDTAINDVIAPAGSTLSLLLYHMNRNPEIFHDPEKFIPERFLPEETSKRNPFSTVFFSAGPRNCIGQKFAMLEMKSVISKIIKNYKLLPSSESYNLTIDIILKSENGVKIKLADRIN